MITPIKRLAKIGNTLNKDIKIELKSGLPKKIKLPKVKIWR